ncbi:hypothetical protein FB446DRAFT_239823 [Lentinula raphanica]|nr:hypothetical protein FB446DRAFT_239823 [Lentinula raphanica]
MSPLHPISSIFFTWGLIHFLYCLSNPNAPLLPTFNNVPNRRRCPAAAGVAAGLSRHVVRLRTLLWITGDFFLAWIPLR